MSKELTTPRPVFRPSHIILYIFLIVMSAFFLYPVLYSFGVIFMENIQFRTNPPGLIPIPDPVSFIALKSVLMFETTAQYPFPTWILNTVVRAAWFVLWIGLSSLVMGFVFARMKFKAKGFTFAVLMLTSLLPGVVTFTPTFLMMAHFPLVGGNDIAGLGGTGFFNSYPSLLILGMINVSMVFLARMSIEGMPKSMEEAALMDGAGVWTIMVRIVLPMQQPIFAYIGIMTFMGMWGDWFTPFVFNQQYDFQTIASGLMFLMNSMLSTRAQPDWPLIIAQSLVMSLPCIFVYVFSQRYIVQGLTSSAIKG